MKPKQEEYLMMNLEVSPDACNEPQNEQHNEGLVMRFHGAHEGIDIMGSLLLFKDAGLSEKEFEEKVLVPLEKLEQDLEDLYNDRCCPQNKKSS